MGTDDNKAVVRRFWQEVFNDGNLDVVDELFDPEHVVNHPTLRKEKRSSDVMKGLVALFRKIAPDLKVSVEDEIADGEKVWNYWVLNGNIADEMIGNRCAGGVVRLSGISIFRVSGDQIRETWMRFEAHHEDQAPVLRDEKARKWLRDDQLIWNTLGQQVAYDLACIFNPRWCVPLIPGGASPTDSGFLG